MNVCMHVYMHVCICMRVLVHYHPITLLYFYLCLCFFLETNINAFTYGKLLLHMQFKG